MVSGNFIIRYTGEGYGASHFAWSGLVVDMMNIEKGLVPEMNLSSQ